MGNRELGRVAALVSSSAVEAWSVDVASSAVELRPAVVALFAYRPRPVCGANG
jgi:hypothetical protein